MIAWPCSADQHSTNQYPHKGRKLSSGYSDCIDREKIFTAEALRAQSKDFLLKDPDLCELGVSAVNRATAWLQHERLRTQSGWLHLCVVKSPVILIDEFDQGLDGLHLWIHSDFGKIKIFGHEKFIAIRRSTRDPIQRCG